MTAAVDSELRGQLAQLVGHLRGIGVAIETIRRHLHDSEAVLFALAEQHGALGRGEGLTRPEERGS